MKRYSILILLFALSLVAGGAVGYIKAGSIPSLAMGLLSGALLSFCALRATMWSFFWAALQIVGLNLFFVVRLLNTGKLMPSGAVIILSTAVGIPLMSYIKKNIHLMARRG